MNNTFTHNILSIYGPKGEAWLRALPERMEALAHQYGLSKLNPVENLSFNYVCRGFQGNRPIIVKVSPDIEGLAREAKSLRAFQGYGSVQVCAEVDGFLLLDQAIPGTPLHADVKIGCEVMKQLHQAPSGNPSDWPHIQDQLKVLDQDWDLPVDYLKKARHLRTKLCAHMTDLRVLHGDLHHENILASGDHWVVIDPKGVWGTPMNEGWCFIKNVKEDTEFVAQYFGFDLQALREWYFVQAIMAVCWCLEDKTDVKKFWQKAQEAYGLV